jgi:hypothetical protein
MKKPYISIYKKKLWVLSKKKKVVRAKYFDPFIKSKISMLAFEIICCIYEYPTYQNLKMIHEITKAKLQFWPSNFHKRTCCKKKNFHKRAILNP